MRFSMILLASLLAFTGCKKESGDDQAAPDGGGGSGSNTNPGDAAFTITSEDVTLPPNTEKTYCYWFHTPNTSPIAVNKWVSDMTQGSHHMILFLGGPEHADGIDPNNTCGNGTGGGTSNQPNWTFASQTPHLEEDLPTDDGAGKPLAQVIQPNTVAAFQMHYLNATDNELKAHVTLSAYKLDDAVAYTRTDAYVTYQYQINIPAHATNVKVPGSCPVPAGAKFWTVSTHAHKQAIETDVLDGTSMIFQSHDWEHPGAKDWMAMPYYTFADKLNWSCTYNNTGDNAANDIQQGTSAATNEMCMATGYYFPATKAQFCVAFGANQCQCF